MLQHRALSDLCTTACWHKAACPQHSGTLTDSFHTHTTTWTAQARVTQIVVGLGTYASSLLLDRLTGSKDTPEVVRVRAQQLRELLTTLGPSFIKAGQVLANRPDIVREDYMNELCILQDDVPPFPDEQAFAIIEKQLGAPLETLFSSISERPVAAASLGQVRRGSRGGEQQLDQGTAGGEKQQRQQQEGAAGARGHHKAESSS